MNLLRHPNSPYWYVQFKGPTGVWLKKSTGTADKAQALIVGQSYARGVAAASKKQLDATRIRTIVERTLTDIAELVGTPISTVTTGEFFAEWIKTQEASQLALSSLQRYRRVVNSLKEFLGSKWNDGIGILDPSTILEWRNSLHKGLSPVSVAGFLKVAKFSLNVAVRMGYIPDNPALKLPRMSRATEVGSASRRPFTLDEVRLLLRTEPSGEWHGLILAGFYTGQRLGDLVRLKWSQIDLVGKSIAFRQQKTRGKHVPVPIAPQLEKWLLAQAGDDPGAFLFPSMATMKIPALSKQFRRILVRAGLAGARSYETGSRRKGEEKQQQKREVSELSFHSLRHCLATQLRAVGASEAVAMAVLGHESEAVAKHYTHIGVDELRPMMARLPDL